MYLVFSQEDSESDGDDDWEMLEEVRGLVIEELNVSEAMLQHFQRAGILPEDFAKTLARETQREVKARKLVNKIEDHGRKGFSCLCQFLDAAGQNVLLARLKSLQAHLTRPPGELQGLYPHD